MAEAVVLVCDQCGRPGATSVTIRAGDRNYVKDLCNEHLQELLKDTRAPRRGRPRTSARSKEPAKAATRSRKRTGRAKRSSRKRSAAKRSSRKRTAATS